MGRSLLSTLAEVFKTLWPDLRSFLMGAAGYQAGKSEAKQQAEIQQAKEDVHAAKVHQAHAEANAGLSDAAARDKLRNRAAAKGKPTR